MDTRLLDSLDTFSGVRLYGLKTWPPGLTCNHSGRETSTIGGVLHRESIVMRHTFVYTWPDARTIEIINQNTSPVAGRAWLKQPNLRPAGIYEVGLALLMTNVRPPAIPQIVTWRRQTLIIDRQHAQVNSGLWQSNDNGPVTGITGRARLPGVDVWLITGDFDAAAVRNMFEDLTELNNAPEILAQHRQQAGKE